ncbi:hypothetical protein D3C81_1444590 [compost metagenome]
MIDFEAQILFPARIYIRLFHKRIKLYCSRALGIDRVAKNPPCKAHLLNAMSFILPAHGGRIVISSLYKRNYLTRQEVTTLILELPIVDRIIE